MAVGDAGGEHVQLHPLGPGGQEPQRRVRLEDRFLDREHPIDLEVVIHHRDVLAAHCIGGRPQL